MLSRRATLAAIATAAFAASVLVSGQAEARGKPGGSGTAASLKLNQTDPRLGDLVNFTYSGTSKEPRIQIACYQGGLNVTFAVDQAASTWFLLGGSSSEWKTNGGSADCVAYLYTRNIVDGTIARTSFTAGPAR